MAEPALEKPSRRAEDWLQVDRCPACGGEGAEIGPLFSRRVFFADISVPPPPAPITLKRCRQCTLIFKNLLPAPHLLQNLTELTEERLWTATYDFAAEIAFIGERVPDAKDEVDVLDIGAAGGEFLRRIPGGGRRSGLDIVPFSRLETRGEFIRGFIESPDLSWSGEPYRVVTAFDVFEHLYNPRLAGQRLSEFVRDDGIIIIETGDSDALSPSDLPFWSYANYVEHHIFWNRRSLSAFFDPLGFELLSFERKQHKITIGAPVRARQWLRYGILRLAPTAVRAVYERRGRRVPLISRPRRKDHFRAVLGRK